MKLNLPEKEKNYFRKAIILFGLFSFMQLPVFSQIFMQAEDYVGMKGVEYFAKHMKQTGKKRPFYYAHPVTNDWNQDLVENKDIQYRIESTKQLYGQFTNLTRLLDGIQG